jgi:hypothetical protein
VKLVFKYAMKPANPYSLLAIILLAAFVTLAGCVPMNNAPVSPDNHFTKPYAPQAPP